MSRWLNRRHRERNERASPVHVSLCRDRTANKTGRAERCRYRRRAFNESARLKIPRASIGKRFNRPPLEETRDRLKWLSLRTRVFFFFFLFLLFFLFFFFFFFFSSAFSFSSARSSVDAMKWVSWAPLEIGAGAPGNSVRQNFCCNWDGSRWLSLSSSFSLFIAPASPLSQRAAPRHSDWRVQRGACTRAYEHSSLCSSLSTTSRRRTNQSLFHLRMWQISCLLANESSRE